LPRIYAGKIYGGHIGCGRSVRNHWLQGSEQAHKVRAVKGARERSSWELQSPYLRQEFAPHLCGENLWWRYRVWTRSVRNQFLLIKNHHFGDFYVIYLFTHIDTVIID